MAVVKTSSGFECELDESVLDNMELVDALARTETDPIGLSPVCELLLGRDKKRLYDHLRTPDGRVPMEAVSQEIIEIFGQLKAGKN